MRELKFRAWDKKEKRMFKVWSLTFSGINHPEVRELMNRPHPRFSIEEAELKHHPLDTILMQHAGLKDKNSKEIYEGDIVKLGNGDLCIIKHYSVDNSCSMFIAKPINKNPHAQRYTQFSGYVEVIGNIYENPDLLKVE